MSDFYEFNMDLFLNGKPREFLLFVQNINITLMASGTLTMGAKIQYLRTLVHGEKLCQFDSMHDYLEGTNPLTVESIILGLAP